MCYNPMLAEKLPVVNPKTGKQAYRFCKSLKFWIENHPEADNELREFGSVSKFSHFSDSFAYPTEPYANIFTGEYIGWRYRKSMVILPCGQCLECRCQHAQEWANRIMLESKYHEKSYFVTLTYDDEHIPCAKSESGDEVFTLDPKDLQDFIKRLRRSQDYHKENKIRYYAVGEYGSQFHRPHYHAIIFGLLLDDIEEIGKSKLGRVLHDSKVIRRIWNRGLTEVDEMTWETAAYCARYTTKKLGKAETDFYEKNGLVPEFSRMSLKPAIGWQYFDDHKEQIYEFDEIYLSAKGGITVKPPHYYDKKYDDIYPAGMMAVKANRADVAEKALVARMDRFDGSYLELLAQKEHDYKQHNKTLRRNLL